MAIESDADRLSFLEWDEAVIGGTRYQCAFARPFVDELEIAGHAPVVQMREKDITESGIAVGGTVAKVFRFDGTSHGPYTVRVKQLDGYGMGTLVLEEQ